MVLRGGMRGYSNKMCGIVNERLNGVGKFNAGHIGQRDMEETIKYNSQDIRLTGIKCFDEPFIQGAGVDKTFIEIDSYVEKLSVNGFWIHFDTDVIEDESNPAVDYRLPGGLSFAQCEFLLKKNDRKISHRRDKRNDTQSKPGQR